MRNRPAQIFILVISFPTALFCLGVYIREVIVSFSANDKSLLFWYLPFLFTGIISGVATIASLFLLFEKRDGKAAKTGDSDAG